MIKNKKLHKKIKNQNILFPKNIQKNHFKIIKLKKNLVKRLIIGNKEVGLILILVIQLVYVLAKID